MASTVDPKVFELAAHFLLDHPLLNTEAARVTLAAAIQEAIENELFFLRDTMGAGEMKSRDGWKWYGYAGHLIVSSRCAYHLSTRVGGYLISTVGDYRPHGGKRETIGAGPDSFFETYVFECYGEYESGDPIIGGSEIDGKRYAESIDAERGHYEFCEQYAEKQ